MGNGDPSCHEADVYITPQPTHAVALKNWRMKLVDVPRHRPETAETFDDSQWDTADVSAQSGPLTPGQSAVYRASFEADADMLASPSVSASFGMIDDDGWVYLNGQFAGESHDWSAHQSFDLRKFLHDGKNTIAVAVHNGANSGGINKGVSLAIAEKPVTPQWKRSVFNGLAELIVQAGKEAGTIALTAHAEGLSAAELNITANAAAPRPAVP